ncbi:PREDICTED: pleckstrin homology domain-containing protein 1-like [Fragaria vesca subsp. vesca]|uniref:pleckstrin homology domain-containing protein 1-like n=1 Tax=Fragaria vesca subsp. vesca TaxID=101020 RepID=UPI0002C2FAC5|nr:PREDICTED: pleckstrin homology domain-containing protein 1-like [Fragaria vesca subsp. vesca]
MLEENNLEILFGEEISDNEEILYELETESDSSEDEEFIFMLKENVKENPEEELQSIRCINTPANPKRTGWLTKQGKYIKMWCHRWFVLKQGKLFWFKDWSVTPASRSRGVIPVATCLTVKGTEDMLNKQYSFKLSTRSETMHFIADSEKEKEDWINSIGRSIVQHSRSVTDSEVVDYDSYKN